MQEVDLINQEELDKNRTILNFEFEQLIQNDFNQNESVVSFAYWLDEYLKFVDEVKDGKTYLKKILEYDLFFDQVITKYPFCLNENLFDPESMFSENELIIWNSTIKYFQNYKNQYEKLKKVSEELMFDLYFNKLKRLVLISSNLIDVLNLKKQINNESLISDELIKHLCQLTENSSQSKFSNRIEIVEATENKINDLNQDGLLNKNISLEKDEVWKEFFTSKDYYDFFLFCKEKLPNNGKKSKKNDGVEDKSELSKYSAIFHFFHKEGLIFKYIKQIPFIAYLKVNHNAIFPDKITTLPFRPSKSDENFLKSHFKNKFQDSKKESN